LVALESEMDQVTKTFAETLTQIHPTRIISAQNLLKYLILRKTDIQRLQEELHLMGLSSLASCESHTHFQIQSILERLGRTFQEKDQSTSDYGAERIHNSSESLYGKSHLEWPSSIMVTMDSSFLEKKNAIRD